MSEDSLYKTSFIERNGAIKTGEIAKYINDNYISGDNQKYMKMYNWMSKGYDFAENFIGKLKYGNAIKVLRRDLISRLEWKNNYKVLSVSVGTGKDLEFIPENIDLRSLKIVGIDISLGMLEKCKSKFDKKLNISLVNCCAEDLPFNDEQFDIVFHNGGINFFNDKGLAIKEMIRVAKKGTKILIADETDVFIQDQFKKNSLSKKYFEGKNFDLSEVLSVIPTDVIELKTEYFWENKFYCIIFRK